ncbi:hypothetical protein A9B99_06035 [Mangrovibacter phragmitis]|uniref:SSU ribosomal protein S2p (SAe) n=1 Tax=Mangrovibacter phragmitis TaxID=1691903 RepID=A0A1B7L394_9ENTR|nr:hypothetical protein [Mangrovibacter phragmitis]OAT76874.1 hypothetical protein A9B99_06035 [Mangrovibacter phragmitis]
MSSRNPVSPGYCVVQQPGTLEYQTTLLFNDPRSDDAQYFMRLNSDTKWLKPGQILIIAENTNLPYETPALLYLREAKRKVNNALSTIGLETADFLNRNYSTIASLVSWGDTIAGNTGDAGEKLFRQVESILRKIELTYQNQYITQGSLISEQFFQDRRVLFGQLSPLLNKFTRKIIGLRDYSDIKKALGLSSKSIVHEWSTVGVGSIIGYSTYIDRAARAAQYMKIGGWIALGFSFLGTSNDVYHACSVGRENDCAKIALRKYSSFGGGVAGATVGGMAATALAGPVCLALGVPTMGIGTAVCGVAVGLVMTSIGTWAGSALGEHAADGANYLIYGGE